LRKTVTHRIIGKQENVSFGENASMSELSRRHFLAGSAATALSGHLVSPATAAMGPNDKFDLVISATSASAGA
jgi:hypothetical protein